MFDHLYKNVCNGREPGNGITILNLFSLKRDPKLCEVCSCQYAGPTVIDRLVSKGDGKIYKSLRCQNPGANFFAQNYGGEPYCGNL
jgi:hypothetical protein